MEKTGSPAMERLSGLGKVRGTLMPKKYTRYMQIPHTLLPTTQEFANIHLCVKYMPLHTYYQVANVTLGQIFMNKFKFVRVLYTASSQKCELSH